MDFHFGAGQQLCRAVICCGLKGHSGLAHPSLAAGEACVRTNADQYFVRRFLLFARVLSPSLEPPWVEQVFQEIIQVPMGGDALRRQSAHLNRVIGSKLCSVAYDQYRRGTWILSHAFIVTKFIWGGME